jgi:DNA-binding protein YbaB
MSFDPEGHLAESQRQRALLTAHLADVVRDLDRAREDLRHQIQEFEREQAEARTTVAVEGGKVRVVIDGAGTVRQVHLDETWYRDASPTQVGALVLAALTAAEGPAPARAAGTAATPDRPLTGIDVVDDLHARFRALNQRLRDARVDARAPTRDVHVVLDGLGRPVQVSVEFSDARRPAAALLGERVTTVTSSAQHAAATLRQQAHEQARIEARTAAGMPLDIPDGASAVARAFGATR